MKKFIPIILASVLAFSSCDEWLSATSSTTLPAEELFSTPEGFYNALTGAYLLMSNYGLYGGGMTYLYADISCVPYVSSNTAVYLDIQNHQYSSSRAKVVFKPIWLNEYQVIANVNMLLRQLDERSDVLRSDEERNLIRGEALAIRAFIHFDLLRFWGIDNWGGDNAGKLTIPYVTTYAKDVTPQRTYSETTSLLEDDILQALSYLKNDPATGWSSDEFETVCNADEYWKNRARHLNYYAVEMLAARFYMWDKQLDKAQSYAKDIIDHVFDNGMVKWVDSEELMLPKSSLAEIDWTFSTEHIFSVDCQSLYQHSQYLYSDMALSGFFINPDLINTYLYPSTDPVTGSVSGAEDVRGTALMLKNAGNGYMNYKLYSSESSSYSFSNLVPLMKVSEAYYILAEIALGASDNATAIDLLNEVRKHRGIGDMFSSSVDASVELEKEYYREFINEGQLFPYLKRLGKTSSLLPEVKYTKDDFIWPYPQDEINYGRVQEK